MSNSERLDKAMLEQGLVASRSQAGSYIALGKVRVNGQVAGKSGLLVKPADKISLEVAPGEQYVSRAGLKLASVAGALKINFTDQRVLDIGSSTGGFTDYALRHGAQTVVAVDVGTEQLHPALRTDPRVELHEKTDIRDFKMDQKPDLILADLSFISLREVLRTISALSNSSTQIVIMLKPQFEAGKSQINRGVIKNDNVRRQIIKDFEAWLKDRFIVLAKADSEVAGAHGNRERFYLLKKLPKDATQARAHPSK